MPIRISTASPHTDIDNTYMAYFLFLEGPRRLDTGPAGGTAGRIIPNSEAHLH